MAIVNTHYGFCAKGSALNFTYTGSYNVRDDGVVELLTSGTLVFLDPAVIDVFCVGGGASGSYRISGEPVRMGGGGGGGGYTATKKRLSVNGSITVTIGDGAPGTSGPNKPGGATSFGNFLTAKGGAGQTWATENGTNGGSGGGGGASSLRTGGTGGSNGEAGEAATGTGGSGQNSTTREFGEPTGKLYAGGGGGGRYISGVNAVISAGGAGGGGNGGWCGTSYGDTRSATSGVANTGGGGGGGAYSGPFYAAAGGGGSGIVCFRKAV